MSMDIPAWFGVRDDYAVGDAAWIYLGNHDGELTEGKVIAVLDLPGFGMRNYVIQLDTEIEPLLEIRNAFTMRRMVGMGRDTAGAHITVMEGLLVQLMDKEDMHTDPPCTSASYLREFIGRAIEEARSIPIDKLGRWTGFIQGVMAARGWLDVRAERDRTRPIFTGTQQ